MPNSFNILFKIILIILFLGLSLIYLPESNVAKALIVDCADGGFARGYCEQNPDATPVDCGGNVVGTGQTCCNRWADLQGQASGTCSGYCEIPSSGETCSLDSDKSCLNSSCFGVPTFCCNYSNPPPPPPPPAVCSSNLNCVDGNPCTEDICNNPGTSSASCSHSNYPAGTVCAADGSATCDGNGNCIPTPTPTCSSSNCGACGDCGSCITNASCGWTGSSCESGTASCPAGYTNWYWTSCSVNVCQPPPPQCTPDGSCSALTPSCGETTAGADNCGNPCSKTGPACTSSCSVSWTFSNPTPPSDTPVNVTVDGNSNFGWSGASYNLDNGGWVNVNSSAPPFQFGVNSDSAGPHALQFSAISPSGRIICGSSGVNSFSTQGPTYYQIGGRVTSSTASPLGNVCMTVYDDTNSQQTRDCNSVPSLLTNNGNYWIDNFIRGGDAFAVRAPSVPYTLGGVTYTSRTPCNTCPDYESQTVFANKLDYNFTYTAPLISVFDFSVSSPGNISLVKGSKDPGHSTTITKTTGTEQPVTLSLVGSIGGASYTFFPASCTPNTSCLSTLVFDTSSATSGTYSNLTVRGTSAGGTVRNSSTFTLTITASTQPDLTVDPLSPINVVVNNAVSPTATVRNNGSVTTDVSSTTRLQIDTNNNGSYTDAVDISSDKTTGILGAGDTASHTWSSVWTSSSTGTYPYKICADATGVVTESNETSADNCKTSTITVAAAGSACPTTEGYSCTSTSPGSNCSVRSGYTCSTGSCYFCSPPSAPTADITAILNSCIDPGYTGNGVTISWSSTTNPGVNWVDIDSDQYFDNTLGDGVFYHSNGFGCSGTNCSITAPKDNVGNLFGRVPGPGTLSLNPATTYYVRTFNTTANVHSQTATISPILACVASFNYSLFNSGGITVNQGSSGSNTITRTLISGTPAGVTLSASGLPSGASASLTNNPANPTSSSTLTISTSSTTPTGSYTITVTGSPLGKTTTFTLTVNPPPAPTVILSASPTSIPSGSSTTLTWNITNTATSCAVSNSGTPAITSGDWTTTLTGSDVTNGSHTRPITMTSSASAAKTFNITCTNSGGTSSLASATVTVDPTGGACPITEGYSCAGSSPGSNCSVQSGYTCSTGSCYFCSPPSAPTADITAIPNSCIDPGYTGNGITISWSSTTNPGVNWVDIDSDQYFDNTLGDGVFYHSNGFGCSGTNCSITAPKDNVGNLFGRVPGPGTLSLNPATTYYVRTFNTTANVHSQTATISPILACSATCSGNILLTLTPNPVNASSSVSATTSGLTNCTSIPITVTPPAGTPVSCTSGSTGCTTPSFPAPSTPGSYPVTGCVDKNNNGNCTDAGESTSTTLTVNPPGSSTNLPWIQTTGGDVHSNTGIIMQ